MNLGMRRLADRTFTLGSLLSVALIIAALLALLGPMLWRGSGAVLFRGTVEFRRLQLEQFHHGDEAAVRAEVAQVDAIRNRAYDIFDKFETIVDTSDLVVRARQINREFGKQVERKVEDGQIAAQRASQLTDLSEDIRNGLLAAFETTDRQTALRSLDSALSHAGEEALKDTAAAEYFDMARRYRAAASVVDLGRREKYREPFAEVRLAFAELLGPRPGDPQPAIIKDQYGATRWDAAQKALDSLLWAEQWRSAEAGKSATMTRVPRETLFAGTELAELFPYVRDNAEAMLRPQWTCYYQYFTDDSKSGHFFGGVGPEIIGTLLITVLAIAFALPVGVITAGYLVECAGDNLPTRVLRTCVNTLAGVPSIVFGLFGLAFFVLWFLPQFGMKPQASVLAGGLTLGLLVLPVMIRSSEEAIRTVPRAYREAALALGASRFRCFVSVTLPAALPGILTGLILSMSRAAGETAPVLFAAAIAQGPIPSSLAQPTRTLSYSSYDMATSDKMASLAPHNQFGMVMTLIAIVLILNIAAIIIRGRVSKRLRGQ